MRKLKRPGTVMGIFALALEATGVASGAYIYGDFPLKILGVPLCIPIMWVLMMALAYLVSEKYGPAVGVLAVCGVDLMILEPVAYSLNWWRWDSPYSLLIIPFGTVANALVWGGMCLIGIKLWESRAKEEVEAALKQSAEELKWMRTYNCARVHIGQYYTDPKGCRVIECGYTIVDGRISTKELKSIKVRGTNHDRTISRLRTVVLYPVTEEAIVEIKNSRRTRRVRLVRHKKGRSTIFKARL